MSNEIAIAILKLMRNTIKAKLEQLITEIDKQYEAAIKELEESE